MDSGVGGGACEVATEARPRTALGMEERVEAAASRALRERTEADIVIVVWRVAVWNEVVRPEMWGTCICTPRSIALLCF